jgi:hypothetical protein
MYCVGMYVVGLSFNKYSHVAFSWLADTMPYPLPALPDVSRTEHGHFEEFIAKSGNATASSFDACDRKDREYDQCLS